MSATSTFQETNSLHKCRTELPNILFELGLDAYEIAVYTVFKRIAGDSGKCWAAQESIAKMCGIGLTKLRDVKKELQKPRELLGNVPLIYVQKRPDSGESDIITIEDIWPQNFTLFFIKNKSTPPTPNDTPPSAPRTPPPPRGEPKEDLLEEDLNKDSSSPTSSPSLISDPLTLRDEMKRRISCTDKEFEEAWKKYKNRTGNDDIPYLRAYLEKIILEDRKVIAEEVKIEADTESEQQRLINESLERLQGGFYDY